MRASTLQLYCSRAQFIVWKDGGIEATTLENRVHMQVFGLTFRNNVNQLSHLKIERTVIKWTSQSQ